MNDAASSARLMGWTALVSALALVNYASRLAGGKPPKDALYRTSTAVGGLIEFAIILGFLLLIARGADRRELFALRRPASWRRAGLYGLAVLGGIYLFASLLEPVLHAGREQGLTPSGWDSARAGAFVANALVVCVAAPIVEELTFRGMGYTLLARFGTAVAIVLVGLSFGLAHGLVQGLVILATFGAGLAWLRSRTDSVYPGMFVHGAFNAIALIVAVSH